MSEVRVNKLSPRSGTTVTLGDSGDTITIPSGVTFDASSGGLAGTLTTAAQPNITSVGTLTSFTSTGIDDNATSTAVTINSSGNLLVGKTSQGSDAVGVENRGDGLGIFTRDGNTPVIINRKTSDGTVIDIKKDGTSVGSIDVTSTGIGIYLGGTGTANKLDDYEEGTWTPQYDNNSNNLAVTYNLQTGFYRKIGSVVFISGELSTDAVTRSGVWIKLDNLPFAITTAISDNEAGGINIHSATAFSAAHPFSGLCNQGVAGFILQYRSTANGSTLFLEDGDMTTGGTDKNKISFSGFYITD